MEESYIKRIRSLVGDEFLILNATAVVIVNHNNDILLQKRSDNGYWGLPGGLLELNDSITEGAIREVKEETNLDIAIKRFIGVFVNPFMRWKEKDTAKVYSFAFLGEVIGGELRVNDSESTEMQYFSYENLPNIHSIDNIQVIQAYYNNQYNLVEGEKYDG
ncbi:MAG: NUDIX domain-containing protein [Candidatus Izemoplasmatales bacterium]